MKKLKNKKPKQNKQSKEKKNNKAEILKLSLINSYRLCWTLNDKDLTQLSFLLNIINHDDNNAE